MLDEKERHVRKRERERGRVPNCTAGPETSATPLTCLRLNTAKINIYNNSAVRNFW